MNDKSKGERSLTKPPIDRETDYRDYDCHEYVCCIIPQTEKLFVGNGLDLGSIRSRSIWNSARLFHNVLFNMGNLHLALPDS